MVEFDNRLLDPQCTCGQTLLGSDQSGSDSKKKRRYIEFVTTSVTFYLIFPKFSTKINIFDDLDKVTMNILNLMCSHGPWRWVDAQRCPELDLKFSRSNLISKSALTVLLQTHELNQFNILDAKWSIDMLDTHETYQSPQKSVSLSKRS